MPIKPRSFDPIRIDITTYRAEEYKAVTNYKTDKIIINQTATNCNEDKMINIKTTMDSNKSDKVNHQTLTNSNKSGKMSHLTTMDSLKSDKISHLTFMDSHRSDKVSHETLDSHKSNKISHQNSKDSHKSVDQNGMETYKTEKISDKTAMESDKTDKLSNQTAMNNYKLNKIICPFCLNSRNNPDNKNKCPFCLQIIIKKNIDTEQNNLRTVAVQTSEKDLAKGLYLLHEILTEFQNKKSKPLVKDASVSTDTETQNNNLLNEVLGELKNKKSKTTFAKDACVSTELKKPKLCFSRVFVYTVEGDLGLNKFTVICSSKDNFQNKSVNLIKHKAYSVPLMKMDELKNSFKQKTLAKDTIEEVNRLFGKFPKNQETETQNRPLIRHGPRMLPVVLTQAEKSRLEESKISSCDSFDKKNDLNVRCDKCVYLLCCHYKNTNKMQSLICKECQTKNL